MASSSSTSAALQPATTPRKPAPSPEPFDSLRRRNAAAEILQSYEKLSWMSFQRCESLAQTRAYFRRLVAGLPPDDEAAPVRWREDFAPHAPRAGEEAKRAGRKGKDRVSVGERAGEEAGRADEGERKRRGK